MLSREKQNLIGADVRGDHQFHEEATLSPLRTHLIKTITLNLMQNTPPTLPTITIPIRCWWLTREMAI